MSKKIIFPLLGTLLGVSLFSNNFVNVASDASKIVEQNYGMTEVAEDLNNVGVKLTDVRKENSSSGYSRTFVQVGTSSEDTKVMRFAVAVKNITSLTFVRHIEGLTDSTKVVSTVYKSIKADGVELFYDGNGGTTTTDPENGYYWACYTIEFSNESTNLDKNITVYPTADESLEVPSITTSYTVSASENFVTASYYDDENNLLSKTIVEKGKVPEFYGTEIKNEKRIGEWNSTQWIGKLNEDTDFTAKYYDVVTLDENTDLISLNDAIIAGETANKYYLLEADLDVTSMIGQGDIPFEGVLDGNGYKFNLSLTGTADFTCLIAYNAGLLTNIYTTGSVTSTNKFVAAITSKNNGYLTNCINEASVHSDVAEIGGLVCYNRNTIYNSVNKGEVDGTYTVGGINAYFVYDAAVCENPVILDCINEGKVYSNAYLDNTSATATTAGFWVGGIVGTNYLNTTNSKNLTIENCTNKAEVRGAGGIRSGDDYTNNRNYAGVGGIVGANWQANLLNCTNIGDVRGYHYFGGIAGTAGGTIKGCTNKGFVNSNTETNANVSSYQGGIVGFTALGILENNNNYGNVRAYQYFGGVIGCFGAAEENVTMTNCNNYGEVYTSAGSNEASHSIGGIVGYLGAYHTLVNCDNDGVVKGIGNYNSNYSYAGVGGIAGTVLANVTISQCDNTGDITAVRSIGGIAGSIIGTNVTIDTCINNCSFLSRTSKNQVIVGGIFGHTTKSGLSITNCSSTMELSFESTTLEDARYVGLIGGFATAGTSPTITNNTGVINNSPFSVDLPNVGTATSLIINR